MVAFLTSVVALVVICAAAMAYGYKKRAVGAPLSWGEAMVGAAVSFFAMFLAYGVIPHQWLTYAGNELGWRKDKIIYGPANIIDKYVPFTVSYEAVQDGIAAGLYIVFLGIQIALFAMWQGRDKRNKPKEIETSAFGRPLVKGS